MTNKLTTLLLLIALLIPSSLSSQVTNPLLPPQDRIEMPAQPEAQGDDDEIVYRIPDVIVNFTVQYETENNEVYPGFLERRGDYRKLKEVTGNGKGVKVGIVDTGVSREHRNGDLKNVVEARDFTRSRSGWNDLAGHGSHVAGHIGAAKDGSGIEGIASECELYIAKGLGDRGFGTETQIAQAIYWLIEMDVDIINLSIGGGFAPRIEQAVKAAAEKGILVFAAMGNEGNRGDSHPGNSDYTFGICALDYNLRVANFSSRSNKADMSGYGVDIFSCVAGGRYAAYSGTSMATPDQVGCAALVLGHQRKLGNDITNMREYFELLTNVNNSRESYLKDLGAPGRDREYGWGFFQIDKYLAYYENQPDKPEDPKDPDKPEDPKDPDKPEEPANPFENYEIIGKAEWNNEKYILLKEKK